jgi:PhzF family phenazine biosynthesis protein
VYVGQNKWDYLVEVQSEEIVRNIKPDIDSIAQLPIRGIIVTSRSDSSEYDFVSRFFSPAQGLDEDHVTGSAHCCLGPYWKRKLDKSIFIAYQASERGGLLKVEVTEDTVKLSGHAVTIFEGNLNI